MAKKENTLKNLVNKDADAVEETETSTAIVPASDEETAITVADTTAVGEIGGAEITADDLIIPRLIPVHGVGDLSREFDPGTFCIDGEAQLLEIAEKGKRSTEIDFIPLKAVKVFREVFDYNDASTKDSIPREFASEEAVVEAGGRVSTWESGEGVFQPALNVLLALVLPKDEVPEDLESVFVDEFGDCAYGIVATRWMKSAYKSAGKQLMSDYGRRVKRMGGLPFAKYRLWTENMKKGDNYVWTPVVKIKPGSNPKELVEFFRTIVG